MDNPIVSNPNDFKVVEFHNSTDFTFTPEMGCMYDGRPISGITGAPGINGGETITLPYHIAHRLAENLAKYVMIRGSNNVPTLDAQGNPIVAAIWDTAKMEQMKNSYITEMYSEAKPIAQTETDRLMAKVEEYKQMVDKLLDQKAPEAPVLAVVPVTDSVTIKPVATVFQDKSDVIKELERLNIVHNKRSNQSTLEALLPVA